MERIKIGLLYLGLHNQLIKKFGINHIITRKDLFCKLGKHYILPKNLRPIVIKEMAEKGLIERVDRDNLKILPCDIDLEKDCSKLSKLAGLY
ncbi:MAG TPA: hypothetical protein VJ438_05365 [Candidatus Nanoarchaeia archaeon]|nr:hypothetical protein [Candidatus Nanoarchaeia archaeon]